MRGKLMFLAGAGAGYVLGARAGRERYDQMKAQADSVIHDPRVQEKVSQAGATVRDKAPDVQAKVSEAAGGAASTVRDKTENAASTAKHRASGNDETRDSLIGEEASSDYSPHQVGNDSSN